MNRASKDVIERRMIQWDDWIEFRLRCLDAYDLDRAAMEKLVGVSEEWEESEEVVEEVIEETEEVIEVE
jgi:hypothetical protein